MRSLPLAHTPGGVYYQYIFFPLYERIIDFNKGEYNMRGQCVRSLPLAHTPGGVYYQYIFFPLYGANVPHFLNTFGSYEVGVKGKAGRAPLDLPSFNSLIPIMTKYLKDCDLSEIFPHLIDYAILSINSS